MNILRYVTGIMLLSTMVFTAWSEEKSEYIVRTGDFTELVVKHGIPVRYVHSTDSAGVATFNAVDSTAHAIMFENKRGRLTLTLEPKTFGLDHELPEVTVRSSNLMAVYNEGDSMVLVTPLPKVPFFKAELKGNGFLSVPSVEADEVDVAMKSSKSVLSIGGKCRKLSISNSSAGSLQAGNLKAEDVVCSITGTGTVDCYATVSLTVKGISSGKLYYGGSPATVKNNSLGVKLTAIE